MTQILKYGISFVSGVPTVETSHEKCELRALAELFGELRPTFYGLLWNVMNIPNSRNIAYTNLDLGLHMDLLYDLLKFSILYFSNLFKGISNTHPGTKSCIVCVTVFREELRSLSMDFTLPPLCEKLTLQILKCSRRHR
jgi:hypothetical protein